MHQLLLKVPNKINLRPFVNIKALHNMMKLIKDYDYVPRIFIFVLTLSFGVFPKMREASMKREKRPITVPPFTTEVSNTIHLHELMAPPLLHLITTKKPKIEPMTQTLLPGEIGGKVLTFLYLNYLVINLYFLNHYINIVVSLLQVLCITKRTNVTSPRNFAV